MVVLLSLFRATLCASFVHEPECHQSRGAAASQVQRRCSLKQEAVGRKHQPSSSNCCHLWKGGADIISKPETQEDCSFGLSFHFCSPKRLRSRVRIDPGNFPQASCEQEHKQPVLSILPSLTLLPDPAHFSFTVASHGGGAFCVIFQLTQVQ